MKCIFTLLLLVNFLWANAQRCATEPVSNKYAFSKGGNVLPPAKWARDTASNEVIVIPVVVHVVYHAAQENITDKQIHSQIEALNRDFRRRNEDTVYTPAPFKPAAADARIEFRLATVSPNGQPTNGIVRVYTSQKSFLANDNMKFNDRGGSNAWDASRYLNIWVCNLFGRTLGYAVLPGGAPARDGVVIKHTAFGTGGTATAPFDKGRTATHEIGHWLGLAHIWGNGVCGDDGIADTPPQQAANQSCAQFPRVSACSIDSNGDMFMNFMDLTNDACMNLFTRGQAVQMRAQFARGGPRNSMLTASSNEPAPAPVPLPNTGEQLSANIAVFPNPVSHELIVSLHKFAKGASVHIFDRMGRPMVTQKIQGSHTRLNVRQLAGGVYLVKVFDGNREKTFKIVK